MQFTATITLGNIVEIASIVIGTLAIYGRVIERLIRIETKVDVLWNGRSSVRRETDPPDYSYSGGSH